MAFDELNRRQKAISARRRKKPKFSLLLSKITVPSNSRAGAGRFDGKQSRIRYVLISLAPILFVVWLFFGGGADKQQKKISEKIDRGSVRNKYWKANIVEHKGEDNSASRSSNDANKKVEEEEKQEEKEKHDNKKESVVVEDDKTEQLSRISNSSRPFLYIGDYDPTKPQPWPKDEKDWWSLHETLVKNVKTSDESKPKQFDINDKPRLPQLIFYGDSITEGWGGTTFGNVPGKHRMWHDNEDVEIKQLFASTFGEESTWGKRALKPPLVLGISGSRTYDFIWRIKNGEFPTSQLLGGDKDEQEENEDGDAIKNIFQLDTLERIYIVLIGTNNLGGGMLPDPTVKGMDAVGRAILQLHMDNFPNTPSAMLFSELLPRHDDFRAAKMCPPRCANMTTMEPYKSFMPAIEKVNRALPDVVDGWRKDFENSRIVLLTSTSSKEDSSEADNKEGGDDGNAEEAKDEAAEDDYTKSISCGKEIFSIDNLDELDKFMPDRLHPNAKGYQLWSGCLKKGLEVIMDGTVSLEVEK